MGLLNAMHDACTAGLHGKVAPEVAHTSLIYRIFAGRMCSQVRWASFRILM